MGSSKKHKSDREHKRKHKHRSRSRSGSRERKSKREERKRRRDEEEEVEEVPVKVKKEEPEDEPSASKDGAESLSIEETNKIRARLGLKPLEIETVVKSEDAEPGEVTTTDGDIHRPAQNLDDIKKSKDFKDKLEAIKEKRRINKKLGKVKTLGESSSDEEDSAMAWIKKSRKLQKEKEKAEKRAKMLEELDNDFGVGDLVSEEFQSKPAEYKSRDLAGLTVEHGVDSFKEGRSVILTLKDQGVLEEGDETLVNVNMVDDERYKKNVENKKNRPDYKPYDDEDDDQFGMLKMPKILGKYDEEIEGEKKKKFQLTSVGDYDTSEEARLDQIRQKLKQQSQTLETAPLTVASEFYTPEEMSAKFKKVKRKVRKIRKAVKADDLIALEGGAPTDHGSRNKKPVDDSNNPVFSTDILQFQQPDVPVEDNQVTLNDEAELELQLALNKSRKLRQQKERANPEKIAEQVRQRSRASRDSDAGDNSDMDMDEEADGMVLNATSEFCRTLGDIPTYGLAGNRTEERDELLDLELELLQEKKRRELEEEEKSGWEAVEIDAQPVEIKPGEDPVTGLDIEPTVSSGVVATLALAEKKGYLEGEGKKASVSKPTALLASDNYSIEDKRLEDDDKYKRRERYSGGGMLAEFREKSNYKPDINIEYADEHGRILNPKEAFKQLSYRFHGKGSGKKKTEKRLKKIAEENLMKQMSSTDTPLSTVSLFREKQKNEKTPFIMLSGGQKNMTSLTK